MIKIPLIGKYAVGESAFALVDDHLSAVVLAVGKWVAWREAKSGKIYPVLSNKGRPRPLRDIYLHRFVYELENGPIPLGMEIDHVDSDSTVDARMVNLRLATRAQNRQNSKLRRDSTTGYKGVCRNGQLHVNDEGVDLFFGIWEDKELAARFYDVLVFTVVG